MNEENTKSMRNNSCDFCQNPSIQSRIIYKDTLVWTFPTNIPIVPGHILVCPVRCISKIDDLTEEEWVAIRNVILKLKTSLQKTFKVTGFNTAWNEGRDAGQSIQHLHIHLLPRKAGDEGITEYDPRKFLYRPGSRTESPQEELQDIAFSIKKNL